jgi:hypothetical protein
MTERFGTARSGLATAFLGATALHSNYDPQKEAGRYIASLAIKDNARIFIFVEPCLGYTVAEIRRRFSGAFCIALHCSPAFFGKSGADAEWHPRQGAALGAFLAAHIPDDKALDVQLIEWKPAMHAYGRRYADLLSQCAVFLKRAAAGARTAAYFARRWEKNRKKNLVRSGGFLSFSPGDIPLIITASGPSLETALPLIKAASAFTFILAVSSSAPALLCAGIQPNLVLSIDGGFWAKSHLLEVFRLRRGIPLAIAVNAALPSQYADQPLLLITNPSCAGTFPFLTLPERGTVSAQALDLALLLSGGPLYFAGLDLTDDIKSHVRPYALDPYIEQGTNRFESFHSRSFDRRQRAKDADSFGVYAAWFKETLAALKRPCYFLGRLPFSGPCQKDRVEPQGRRRPVFSVRERP